MRVYNLKKDDWHGFDHEKVCERFEGDLTFIAYMPVPIPQPGVGFNLGSAYTTCAVYHNASPNREKKHKDYMCLFSRFNPHTDKRTIVITGFDDADMDFIQIGKYCLKCKDIIYSINCHDYKTCSCREIMVDGGKDYFRHGGEGLLVKVDLKTDEVKFLDNNEDN